ncbi:hypothetical protein [Chryseobacterium binzhouense]|jgi:hypothetical protein|uniref:hypothetical protein n=1 Tax=Chryseobacterium binzhouense TaxID=2593646 RepID=UPI00118052D2|nr:hypothetical protein [Chryseobacterium binzhouense]MXS69704.1 hypothetical protein [Flavobacteriaceae bacterium W22]
MLKKLIAGLGGAIALNILHEVIRKNFEDVPHINEIGEEALQKAAEANDIQLSDPDTIYAATLAGDVISNAVYYAGTATNHEVLSGIAAGVGAIMLPEKLGLDDTPVAENNKKKLMTIGYYTFGAIVTKLIYNRIK